eukprot:SAG31_NODE_15055_length_773_cov_0.740356_1_plen_110_part_10
MSANSAVHLSGGTPTVTNQLREDPQRCLSLQGIHWCLGRGCGEQYTILRVGDSEGGSNKFSFNVTCDKDRRSRCTSWQSASGVLDAESQKVTVIFNTGGTQTGLLDPDCQ